MRVGGNIRWQLWHGRIFADVIEGAGNVESRAWYTKEYQSSTKYEGITTTLNFVGRKTTWSSIQIITDEVIEGIFRNIY